jgi:hypothetical protein
MIPGNMDDMFVINIRKSNKKIKRWRFLVMFQKELVIWFLIFLSKIINLMKVLRFIL